MENTSSKIVVIPNKIFFDKSISFEARGIFVTLCSLPPEQRNIAYLDSILPDDRETITRAYNEIMQSEYAGEIGGYVLYER